MRQHEPGPNSEPTVAKVIYHNTRSGPGNELLAIAIDKIIPARGVLWCAVVPGREPVWSRQLCTAIKLARMPAKKVKQERMF